VACGILRSDRCEIRRIQPEADRKLNEIGTSMQRRRGRLPKMIVVKALFWLRERLRPQIAAIFDPIVAGSDWQ
jgi:hypothetical protein